MFNSAKLIKFPITLEQIDWSLRQLSGEDCEKLDMILDKNFKEIILKRGDNALKEYQKGEMLSVNDLKKEFNVIS